VRPARETTRRAHARKEEQRRQQPEALLNRVRSGLTQQVMGFVCGNLNVHEELQAEGSGQLPDLGSLQVAA
jgi:hypothetical protein